MPATLHRRDAQISLRVTSQQKEFITKAAALETSDVTSFVTNAAIQAARFKIEEHGVSTVTDEMRRRFYDLLLNPPAPNEALIKLMASETPDGFELEK